MTPLLECAFAEAAKLTPAEQGVLSGRHVKKCEPIYPEKL